MEMAMSDDAKKPEIKLVETAPESVFDDIEGLRKTATLEVTRRVVPVNVTVGKPSNNVYFRSHPAPSMSLDASVLVGGDGSDDFYFVAPRMLNHHAILPLASADDRRRPAEWTLSNHHHAPRPSIWTVIHDGSAADRHELQRKK